MTLSEETRGSRTAAFDYMPQLDGLRAFAVAAVVIQHYKLLEGAATLGVHLFFVLSGFLITGILMVARDEVNTAGMSYRRAFGQFYARRALRIFPLYYLVLFVGIAVNAAYAREFAPWLLTYTINIKMTEQNWYLANFAHFWSLAVEEQFYLVWPWLILMLSKRWLLPAAFVMTAVGPLYRLYLVIGWSHGLLTSGYASYIMTPTALDSLGFGSLIAIAMRDQQSKAVLDRLMRIGIPVIGAALWWVVTYRIGGGWEIVLADTGSALFFGWLIYRASTGFGGILGWILGFAPIVFLGRISYGIYVYHPLVQASGLSLAHRFGIALPASPLVDGVLFVALTLVVATISWYAFERPINRLKRHFKYEPGAARPVTSERAA